MDNKPNKSDKENKPNEEVNSDKSLNEDSTVAEKKKKFSFNSRKFKYGSLATGITVIFIAVVVLINVLLGMIGNSHPLKVDLTANKLYDISDETIDYLKNMQNDVDIVVMSDEASFKTTENYDKIAEVLSKYAQATDKINLKYVDIQKNPEEVTKYSQYYSGEISANNIVVSSGNKVRVSTPDNMLVMQADYNLGQYVVVGLKAEQTLTSAIMYVTDSNPKKVGLISADIHSDNSYSYNGLISLLYSNGYELDLNESSGVDHIDLTTQDITDDYDLIVLFAPLNDLTETSVDKLQKFLDNNGNYGKNMLYVGDIRQNLTPNLDAFLEEWGFKLDRSVVQESDSSKAQYVSLYTSSGVTQASASVGTIDSSSEYSENLTDSSLPFVVPYARPIELLWDDNTGRKTTALVKTDSSSFLYPISYSEDSQSNEISEEGAESQAETEAETTAETEFDADSAEKSEQVVMAVGTKSNSDDTASSNLMVMSGAAMADYAVMSSKSYKNSEYIINALNVMSGKDAGIVISEKLFESNTMTISESQVKLIRTVVTIIIPLIVVIVGILVYVRRRNR